MNKQQCTELSLSLLTLITLTSSSSLSSSLFESELLCDVSGCCNESNFSPGPLDLSEPRGGFDARYEGENVFVYHCVRYFTRLEWYRLRPGYDNANDDDDDVDMIDESRLVPYSWGQGGRVEYLPGRRDNQTVLISNVRKGDEGVYVFVASNGTHSVRGRFVLQVDCMEPDPSFSTSEQPVQAVTLGSSRTLRCAAHVQNCPGPFYRHSVFWIWRNTSSGASGLLRNSSLESVSVACDRGGYFGGKCDVLIRRVHEELFNVEFVCKLDDSALNQTVRFIPIKTDVEATWRAYVQVVTGGAVVLVALIGFTWWRYRTSDKFSVSQPLWQR